MNQQTIGTLCLVLDKLLPFIIDGNPQNLKPDTLANRNNALAQVIASDVNEVLRQESSYWLVAYNPIDKQFKPVNH
jgi:hypothetical protein